MPARRKSVSASLTEQQIPAFAQGAAKKLLIGGEWVPARSGRTFSTRNPSSGTGLTEIAEADAADVNLAVAAARPAFEGPWSRVTPAQPQHLLLPFPDLAGQNIDELALFN